MTDPQANPSDDPFLIWEDAEQGHEVWWVARSHAETDEFVIADDPMTSDMLLMHRTDPKHDLKVVTTVRYGAKVTPGDAVEIAKFEAVSFLTGSDRESQGKRKWNWRFRRTGHLMLRDIPLILVAAIFGFVVGGLVGLFFVATGESGLWTVAFGVVVGAILGPVITWVSKLRFGSERPRPLRTALVILCATVMSAAGAAVAYLGSSAP